MKAFGIGAHKTGTSTLAKCLEILGYCVCPESLSYITVADASEGRFKTCLLLTKHFDAFEDSPWNYLRMYEVIDLVYPDAKFILTVRDEERWHRSLMRWIFLNGYENDGNYVSTLGVSPSLTNKEECLEAYRNRNAAAVQYFEGRPNKLLVANWEAGHGWDHLCPFLDVPVPNVPFPHALKYDPNAGEYINR